ncbi:MAG TPA: hypothetical protein VH916_13465 [Dehalococcoidia bacterium]
MTIVLYCTGRGTHAPVAVDTIDAPKPDGYLFYDRHTVMDLLCDRKRGGCGRAPRLSNDSLRQLVNGLAERETGAFDISYMTV